MPNAEWGVKRLCPECTTRFYDLGNDPMTCPNCEATFTVESLAPPKGRSARTAAAEKKPKSPKEDITEVDDVLVDDDDDVDVSDDDVLVDDDDDTVDLEDIKDVASEDDD